MSDPPMQSPRLGAEHVPLNHFDVEGVGALQRTVTTVTRRPNEPKERLEAEMGHIDSDDFNFQLFLQSLMDVGAAAGHAPRTMGLAFSDLTVTGKGFGYHEGTTVGSQFAVLKNKISSKERAGHTKYILSGIEGAVRPREMLLVLGVPGSGCTTLLKTLTCQRGGYSGIDGNVSYAGWKSKDITDFMRGDVVYCGEEDIHFPTLTVKETLEFAVSTRLPSKQIRETFTQVSDRNFYINTARAVLATILGLRRVTDTKVGNELIRGISGGQRKRVSIAEVLAVRGRVVAFDNSTRGLDASTALDFVKALRISTDVAQSVTMASLYQASDAIVRLFDKVTVLYEGHQVFFGTQEEGLEFFHSLGFERRFGQSVGDFLVSVTDVGSRAIRPGFEHKIPKSSKEFAQIWRESALGKLVNQDVSAYYQELAETHERNAEEFKERVLEERASGASKKSRFVITYPRQVSLALTRRYRMFMGDISTFIIIVLVNTFQALITGSVYYSMPKNTSSFFSRGGVLFFALLLNCLSAMTEVAAGYAQRPIVIRQKALGMIHPSADAIANSILALPVKFLQMIPFTIIVYFLTDLSRTASAFWIFFGTILLTTYVMIAFFRMLASIFGDQSRANMVAGLAILVFVLYTGYAIPRTSMVVWWKWLSYCNPLAFAFEMLMSNEFRYLTNFPCAPASLVPPGANLANQVCDIGGVPGVATIDGPTYLGLVYGYYFSNSGRNAGILFGFWIAFTIIYVYASEHQADPLEGGGEMVFQRGKAPKQDDSEENGVESAPNTTAPPLESVPLESPQSTDASDTFMWENVHYDVPVAGGRRTLLNDVSGFVRPGTMTALMGESGAGKTTLLNVLARRTDVGVVTGNFTVSGLPLPPSFQADTGYVQQQDTHMPTTTVREALEFSALLRQSSTIPPHEKIAYVDEVIRLLEMEDFEHALVGQVGEGLSVEQRKRLSIAVELAARPKLLLFLDEPTSGLSAQASWSIVKFLRKLAHSGQAILCTIHQPSGELFDQFDRLLLLRRGGETVYFGDLGDKCVDMISYFRGYSGRDCTPEENPAEYMLEVIATAPPNPDETWHNVFIQSPLRQQLERDLASIKAGVKESGHDNKGQVKGKEYASGVLTQGKLSVKRSYLHYWRSPNYVTAKLALNILAGLFIGSSFWGQGSKYTTAALQNKLFATFMALVLSTSLSQQTQPFFLQQRDLFETRERPSKLYSWPILVLTFVFTEIPWNFLGTTLFWIPWYYMVAYGNESKVAATSWGLMMIFSLYWLTFSTATASAAPNAVIGSTLFSALFSFVMIFCGVTQPPPQMPYFWRSWMPPLSPFTYFIESLMGNTLNGQPVRCSANEFSTIIPPTGLSCGTFLANFTSSLDQPAFGTGYYVNNADGTCGFCPYREGNDFWIHMSYNVFTYSSDHVYRDMGILFAFIAFNTALIFGAFWLFRIRKASEGPSMIQRVLGQVSHAISRSDPQSQAPKTSKAETSTPFFPTPFANPTSPLVQKENPWDTPADSEDGEQGR